MHLYLCIQTKPDPVSEQIKTSYTFSRLEDSPMQRMFGLGPERGMFEFLAPKVRRINYVLIKMSHFTSPISPCFFS